MMRLHGALQTGSACSAVELAVVWYSHVVLWAARFALLVHTAMALLRCSLPNLLIVVMRNILADGGGDCGAHSCTLRKSVTSSFVGPAMHGVLQCAHFVPLILKCVNLHCYVLQFVIHHSTLKL